MPILDKFYTKRSVATKLIHIVANHVSISSDHIVIEPSAGNGAFSDVLMQTHQVLSYDIEPDKPNIIKQDFLTLDTEFLKVKTVHVIGNPPFGRQSSLAKKFIKKCCTFATSISFVLPKSFKKESMQSAFSLNFHLVYSADLPVDSFEYGETSYDVPCVFQIWIRHSTNRVVPLPQTPISFKFVRKVDADFSLRRVGFYAGKLEVDTNKSEQSHYFIKLNPDVDATEFIEKFSTIEFETDNTVGAKSISKSEFIAKINQK